MYATIPWYQRRSWRDWLAGFLQKDCSMGRSPKSWGDRHTWGLAVTVGKALDLRLKFPATNDDNDDDRWSITATVGARVTREMATQTEIEEVTLYPKIHFHLLHLLLSAQQNMRWAIEHLGRGQEVIIGDQHSQSKAWVICNRCAQERHYSQGCAN